MIFLEKGAGRGVGIFVEREDSRQKKQGVFTWGSGSESERE